MAKIFVWAAIENGQPEAGALELLSHARTLGEAEAVALGPGAGAAAARLGEYGAARVHVAEDPAYTEFLAEPAAAALEALIQQEQPSLILFSFNPDPREVAGRVAARLNLPLVSNAVDVKGSDGSWEAVYPVFGGTTLVRTAIQGGPGVVLVRPKSFEPTPQAAAGQVVTFSHSIPAEIRRARITSRVEEEATGPSLDSAAVVVAGGRGLGDAANFKLVEDLGRSLNAAVGATRAIVDAGWVPYALQIGQTGRTVAPQVYVACGISGAVQHWVGMKGAKRIVAINKDPDAPIMKQADLAVVGDVLKIVPQITEEIRRRAGG